MTFDHESLDILAECLRALDQGFDRLPDSTPPFDPGSLRAVLLETAGRLKDNAPYHHPLYIGQMLKPPHAVARCAYALAMFLNPNNHALDGGRATSVMEKEAVARIARMFGWEPHLGHLTGGGPTADFDGPRGVPRRRPRDAVAASAPPH